MNAIPLVFNAPKANINVNSVRPINANPNNKLINATQGMNIGGAAGMLGGGGLSNEAQLRQEVNTSIVALKREAFSLETLIAQAAQTLQDVNKRLSELEGKQGDYVKKSDVVDSITSGNMNPVTSNAVANSNAMPVNSVTSGNMHSVSSNAVANALGSTSCFLIPICLEYQETSSTDYVRYKMIGASFDSYFNDVLPNISGKTKKVKFLISYGTQNENGITIALKRRYDSNYTILVNNDVIWGGKGKESYTKLYLTQELNQNVLDPYTDIVFKSNMSTYVGIIDYIFAYVYYA